MSPSLSPHFRPGRRARARVVGCMLALTVAVLRSAAANSGDGDWGAYLGDPESSHYSRLDQIHTGNVSKLAAAWTFKTGSSGQVQCNPLVIDGVMYGATADLTVFAVDAATGRELWRYRSPRVNRMFAVIRGLLYWEDGADRRILFGAGSLICAVDARTGKAVESFGIGGEINLKQGYDRDASKLFVASTTPGVIYNDLIIVTTRVAEWHPAAPGDIRAFNVRTGKQEWIFHTIPQPGEFGHETWPEDAWKTAGGANCWAGMSLDKERGIVYIPTGSPAYDFYGGDRKGANLFANCLLALNARTGERLWHYQVVRHDLWDRDLPAPPNLLTIIKDGVSRDVAAQITKSGHVFVLDRETGEPVFPIEEVEAPGSGLAGEEAWPRQPLPVQPPPFARQTFTEDDVTTLSEKSHEEVLARLKLTHTGGPFLPPSFEGTVIFPGYDGGGEWGGAAVDPNSGLMVVNSSEMPYLLTMFEVKLGDASDPEATGRRVYAQNCVFCHGKDLGGDKLGIYPRLKDLRARYSVESMSELIATGRGKMPSFDNLAPHEIKAVVDYVLTLDDGAPVEIEQERGGPVLREGEEPQPEELANGNGDHWFAHTGYFRFLDSEGYPAIKPPWGTLSAIDLNRGEMVWQVPLGHHDELTERGVVRSGTENYGGPIITAGGLVFIAATKDEKFRAFDQKTGEVLWETRLPAGGYATPCTYEAGGRQYVVVAAGGGKMGTPAGDSYVAFALPEGPEQGEGAGR